MRKLLVTGAAGSVGSAVVRGLAAEGANEIVALDWRSTNFSLENVTSIKAEISSLDVKELLDGVDGIVYLEWRNGKDGGVESVPDSNIENLKSILDAAQVLQVPQFVFLSSATVYGAREQNPVPMTENSQIQPNAEYPYAAQKARAEEYIQAWTELNPQSRTCVLRPAVIVNGSREGHLARVLGGHRAIREPGSDHPVQFVHFADVVSSVVHATLRDLRGEFNVAPNGFIFDSLARELMGASLSSAVPRSLSAAARKASFRLGRTVDAPQVEPYVDYPWVVANDKLRATGWEPQFSNEEALVNWRPSWWTRQTAGRKRTLILAGGTTTIAAVATGAVVGARQILKKK